MGTLTAAITVAVMLALIILGVLLIHALNVQHGQRIAGFRYGETTVPKRRLRGIRATRKPEAGAGEPAHPPVGPLAAPPLGPPLGPTIGSPEDERRRSAAQAAQAASPDDELTGPHRLVAPSGLITVMDRAGIKDRRRPTRPTRRPTARPAERVHASRIARPQGSPPAPTLAEVRVVAPSAEAAREVAETLRERFAGAESGCRTGTPSVTTRLHLTVDTTRSPQPVAAFQSGLLAAVPPGSDQPADEQS